MQKLYWIVGGLVICGAIAGASVAVVSQRNNQARRDEPIASAPPTLVPFASPIFSPVPKAESPREQPQSQKAIEPAPLKLADPRKRLVLVDEVKPGSEFFEFRQRFRQAVQARDVQFVRSLLPPEGIVIGFGGVTPIPDLTLENPQAEFWGLLEKSIANGCSEGAPSQDPNLPPNTPTWFCSNIAQQLYNQYPALSQRRDSEESNQAAVVGRGVNVRVQPSAKSRIIGTLSDELVEVDHKALTQQSVSLAQQGKDYDPINGWTPVILPNQQQGYVSNRYVYAPLDYRIVFAKVEGAWQLLYIPGGD